MKKLKVFDGRSSVLFSKQIGGSPSQLLRYFCRATHASCADKRKLTFYVRMFSNKDPNILNTTIDSDDKIRVVLPLTL